MVCCLLLEWSVTTSFCQSSANHVSFSFCETYSTLSGKQLRFSHDPRKYHDCALEWEWNYIKNKMNIDEFDVDDVLIYREDGFRYVEK